MAEAKAPTLTRVIEALAPGTILREGIDRILASGRGALIVIGWNESVAGVVSGGFSIDTNTTGQRLAELAKMDSAIILDNGGDRILRANVHLVPDHTLPTSETGTRHRTAERVAKQTGRPVVTVSESRARVTVYLRDLKHPLEDVGRLLDRSNQALSTLERYRSRLDEETEALTAAEIEETVIVRDVGIVLWRAEMLRRIAAEVTHYVLELGNEGRLVRLQLEELSSATDVRRVVVKDYLADRRRKVESVVTDLESLDDEELIAVQPIVDLVFREDTDPDEPASPRGYRLLQRVPRLPDGVVEELVLHFGSLTAISEATPEELHEVGGVGEARAHAIRSGLQRLFDHTRVLRFS